MIKTVVVLVLMVLTLIVGFRLGQRSLQRMPATSASSAADPMQIQGLLSSYYIHAAVEALEALDKGESAKARESLRAGIVAQMDLLTIAITSMRGKDRDTAMSAMAKAAPYAKVE
jgi:hypothetical protein